MNKPVANVPIEKARSGKPFGLFFSSSCDDGPGGMKPQRSAKISEATKNPCSAQNLTKIHQEKALLFALTTLKNGLKRFAYSDTCTHFVRQWQENFCSTDKFRVLHEMDPGVK